MLFSLLVALPKCDPPVHLEDANLSMTIIVTSDDIQHGRRCDPDYCPVGRALARAGIQHLGVVGATVILTGNRDRASRLPLPDRVREWIQNFDLSRPVSPISFEFGIAQQAEEGTAVLTTQESAAF